MNPAKYLLTIALGVLLIILGCVFAYDGVYVWRYGVETKATVVSRGPLEGSRTNKKYRYSVKLEDGLTADIRSANRHELGHIIDVTHVPGTQIVTVERAGFTILISVLGAIGGVVLVYSSRKP
jgi:hypothetical protein